jgi:nucleoid DNA-binding protein
MGRNPQTGEAIKTKTVVRRRPAKVLKGAVLK